MMQDRVIVSGGYSAQHNQFYAPARPRSYSQWHDTSSALAASITRLSSKQTYHTIRLLVDRPRVAQAFQLYAYFRWVDDQIDEALSEQPQRVAFLERQQSLIQGQLAPGLQAEEHMLLDLLRSDPDVHSGLHAYIHNMMAVMSFDAGRRGRVLTEAELADYTHHLAVAVTEALHYCIGHDRPTPPQDHRYSAVTGAHITHMLRDACEDTAAGYYNISREFLDAHQVTPHDLDSDAYRDWVEQRVCLARQYFEAGKDYIAQVKSLRCRLAGYAYIARFEWVLDVIEREGYRLRPGYPERKGSKAALRMGWSSILMLARSSVGGNA